MWHTVGRNAHTADVLQSKHPGIVVPATWRVPGRSALWCAHSCSAAWPAARSSSCWWGPQCKSETSPRAGRCDKGAWVAGLALSTGSIRLTWGNISNARRSLSQIIVMLPRCPQVLDEYHVHVHRGVGCGQIPADDFAWVQRVANVTLSHGLSSSVKHLNTP